MFGAFHWPSLKDWNVAEVGQNTDLTQTSCYVGCKGKTQGERSEHACCVADRAALTPLKSRRAAAALATSPTQPPLSHRERKVMRHQLRHLIAYALGGKNMAAKIPRIAEACKIEADVGGGI